MLLLSLLPAAPALALHDQGYICYTCHSLDPTAIRAGSNSVRTDQPILGTVRSGGTNVSRGLPSTGGYPISCDFCHKATDDVPYTSFQTKAYKHPVDLIATGDNTTNPQEITCNDCHAGNDGGVADNDLVPASLLTRSSTDGYPDHDNVIAGYTPHTLAVNKPHLTKPYWGATNPGVNVANDCNFWGGVHRGTQDIVCWVCHESGRTNTPTKAPFTGVTSTKFVKADYTGTGPGAGHAIRTVVAGAMQPGAALPCYDCHDPHGSSNLDFIVDSATIENTVTGAVFPTTYTQAARPYNDLVVCAICHDTGNASTLGTKVAGMAGKVEGLYPVDPYNSTNTAALHRANGVTDNLALSTSKCLSANNGCHASPHNTLGTGNCSECHLGTTGSDNNSFAYDGPGKRSVVDNGQWVTRGHGSTVAFTTASGNPAPNNGTRFGSYAAPNCINFCHDTSILSHAADNTPVRNFFRLALGTGGTGRTNVTASTANDICLQCHSTTGTYTAQATTKVSKAHWGSSHSTQDNNGGFFCWDCHDPHGDNNDYMIHAQVASKTDNSTGASLVGIPKTFRNAAFVRSTGDNTAGYDYMDYRNTTFTGVCQTCHTDPGNLYFSQTKDNTAGHNKGATPEQPCTGCHSHDGNFAGAGACTTCHNKTDTNIPVNPMTAFSATRKHVDNVTAADCEICHHSSQAMDRSNPNVLQMRNADTGAAISYAQDNSGTARAAINGFCLSCHDADGATYTADGKVVAGKALMPFSDNSTVKNMAQFWTYSDTVTSHDNAPSATVNTVPVMNKVRAPHGFPDNNQMKQETVGTGQANQTLYTAASPVSCLQCHPAHGGSITSPTKRLNSVYNPDTGFSGGKMITTAEPALCWNCHDAANVNDYWGDNTAGGHWVGQLNNKFTYKRSTTHNVNASGSTHTVDNTAAAVVCSLCHNPHGASSGPKYYTPMLRGTWYTSPYLEDRTGKLVNTTRKTTVSNMSKLIMTMYGPRGSADVPYNRPAVLGGGYNDCSSTGHDGYFIDENTFGYTGTLASTWSPSMTIPKHLGTAVIADNFGGLCATCHTTSARAGGTVTSMKTYLTTGSSYLTGTGWAAAIHNTVKGWAGSAATSDRVNPTNNPKMHGYSLAGTQSCMSYVTGCSSGWAPWRGHTWGAVPNTANQMSPTAGNAVSVDNAYHQFPCSKCHTPHASDLKRLMVTNCLDVGTATNARKSHGTEATWLYPAVPTNVGPIRQGVAVLCHGRGSVNGTGATDNGWNKVTGW